MEESNHVISSAAQRLVNRILRLVLLHHSVGNSSWKKRSSVDITLRWFITNSYEKKKKKKKKYGERGYEKFVSAASA